MRRALILAAGLAALVAAPTAAAGSFTGVTVAKDAKRKALVVVSGRSVRTVRAGARFARLRVGQRIVIRASRNADGTYQAVSVRPAGLEAGDRVDIVAKLSAAATWSANPTKTGRAKLVQLEGIFLHTKDDGFDLAVVARGLVHVDVPEGAVPPNFEPGDQVSMLVLIGRTARTHRSTPTAS